MERIGYSPFVIHGRVLLTSINKSHTTRTETHTTVPGICLQTGDQVDLTSPNEKRN